MATNQSVAAGAAKARAFMNEEAAGAMSLVGDIPIPFRMGPAKEVNTSSWIAPTIAASNNPVVTAEESSSFDCFDSSVLDAPYFDAMKEIVVLDKALV